MSPQPDENGAAYLRTYRGLDGVVDHERFCEAVVAQGLPAPSKRMFDHICSLYRDGQSHYMAINEFDQMRRDRRRAWTGERVDALVADGGRESERLDFKERIDGSAKKVLAAMANSGGGDVLFGVKEHSTAASELTPVSLHGVEEQLVQMNQQIDPPVNIMVTPLPSTDVAAEGTVWVRVRPSSPGTVHLVDSKAPVRDKTTTRSMTSEEIRRWIREEKRPGRPTTD